MPVNHSQPEQNFICGAHGELAALYRDQELQYRNITDGSEVVGRKVEADKTRCYNLRYHLGSVRVTLADYDRVVGWDDYYPFGLQMNKRSYNAPYEFADMKFTGHFLVPACRAKSGRQEGDLEIYHAQARIACPTTGGYDPAIGRFLGVDAMRGMYPTVNSYHYTLNNPISHIDPTGMMVQRIFQDEDDGEEQVLGYRISGDDIVVYLGYFNLIADGSGSAANLIEALDQAAAQNDGKGGNMSALLGDPDDSYGEKFLDNLGNKIGSGESSNLRLAEGGVTTMGGTLDATFSAASRMQPNDLGLRNLSRGVGGGMGVLNAANLAFDKDIWNGRLTRSNMNDIATLGLSLALWGNPWGATALTAYGIGSFIHTQNQQRHQRNRFRLIQTQYHRQYSN